MESTSHRYVAFLDILGFKQLVSITKHEDLHRLYNNLFVTVAGMATANGAYKIVDSATNPNIAVSDFAKAKIDCMVISDSVLMFTKDDSIESLLDLCVSVGKLTNMGFFIGLPMRGSIALGPLSIFNQQQKDGKFGVYGLVGMSLVNAYSNESKYDWAGCVLSTECLERWQELHEIAQSRGVRAPSIEEVVEHGMLLNYPTPRKNSPPSDQWVINWPNYNRSAITSETVQRSFEMHGKDVQHESVQCKVRNTLDFLTYSNSLRKS